MAGSLNRASLIGHLGKDPESRSMNNGGQVVSFSIATSESWKDKQTGEKREHTDWHNVVIFNEHLAKVAMDYLKKGSKCMVEGKMKTRKWQDQSGADRYTTEVVLQNFDGTLILLGDSGGSGGRSYPDNYAGKPSGSSGGTSTGFGDTGGGFGGGGYQGDLDEDVPF